MVYALADTTALWQVVHWIAPFVFQLGLGDLGLQHPVHRGEELFINYIPGEESKLHTASPKLI